jgi:hypothetical protein
MKNTVTVDDALEQVVEAMKDGAQPWTLGAAAAQRIRDAYRADFEAQLRRPGAWKLASGKILRIARWAGALAALLAETEAGPEKTPGEVPPDHALLGTFAVRHACPIPAVPGGVVVAGRWCNMVSTSQVPAELLRKAASLFGAD